jgi:hypothetical protein
MRMPITATFHPCSPLSSDSFPFTGLLFPGTRSPVHLQLIRCLHYPLCSPPSKVHPQLIRCLHHPSCSPPSKLHLLLIRCLHHPLCSPPSKVHLLLIRCLHNPSCSPPSKVHLQLIRCLHHPLCSPPSKVHLQLIRCLHHPLCSPPSTYLYNRNILLSTSTEEEYMISRFQSGTTTFRTSILTVLLKKSFNRERWSHQTVRSVGTTLSDGGITELRPDIIIHMHRKSYILPHKLT